MTTEPPLAQMMPLHEVEKDDCSPRHFNDPGKKIILINSSMNIEV